MADTPGGADVTDSTNHPTHDPYERGLRDAFEAVLDQLKRQGAVYVTTLLDEMERSPARSTLDALRRDGR
jgi:hypothetical protein